MKVRDLTTAAAKFSTNAQAGANNYANGVSATTNWASQTEAAEGTWKAGVAAAANAGRFGKGVSKAGDGKWKAGVQAKGKDRYTTSVGSPQAKANWQAGFGPYAQVLGSLTLPPKGVKGSPSNYDAVKAVGDALHQKKING